MRLIVYCKEKLGFILFGVISCVLPQLVMLLAVNNKTSEYVTWRVNIRYCSTLLFFLMLIYLTVDYIKTRNRYNILKSLIGNERMDYTIALPKSCNQIDELYTKLIFQMKHNAELKLLQFETLKREDIEFIETWVHEIKTPIAASKLLIENGLDNPSEEVLYHISDEIARIEDMILKSLYYSQLNDSKKDCQIDVVSIRNLVNKSLQAEYAAIREKEIRLVIDNIDFGVYSDEKWLGFIVKQIIDNAVKYSDKNGSVHIYGYNEDDNKKLIIEDNGIGIRKEDLRRIFEKGYTGNNGRVNVAATGIGLYLCNKFAKKLEHIITIESEVGEGTKVVIRFK